MNLDQGRQFVGRRVTYHPSEGIDADGVITSIGPGRNPFVFVRYDGQLGDLATRPEDLTLSLYSEGGPVPTTPEEFAAEVQAIVLDERLTSGAAMDVQLGQLAVAYADSLIPGGLRLLDGPWDTGR